MNRSLPIIAMAFAIVVASCQKKQTALELEILNNETKLVELTQKMRLLTMRWEKLAPTHQEADATAALSNESTLLLTQMRQRQISLTAEISDLEKSLVAASQRMQQQARVAAKGMTLPTLNTKHRNYSDVVITDVSDAGIHIKHKTGSTRIVCDQLTPEQISQFGLNPAAARSALQQEAKQIAAYQSAESQMLLLAQQKEQQRAAIASLYKRTPIVARATPTRSSTYTRPRPVYRVVRRSSSYYTPTYYYNYNTTSTPTQVRAVPQSNSGPNRTNSSIFCP